jgi:predicted ATP-grasp superfamily ATP-dependent carboligase
MTRILLTGARAPATLHLARCLHAGGNTVFAADSCHLPITRGSKAITQFFKLPSPVKNSEAFIHRLLQIIERYQIDWLIPTCEEIFHISKHLPSLQNACPVLTSPIDTLHRLHNKWQFSQLVEDLDVQIPETHLIDNANALQGWKTQAHDYVFKPVYSRFASHTLIRPQADALTSLQVSHAAPWIAQRFISGTEYSSYSMAHQGSVTLHCTYHAPYRAGRGAGIYFVPTQSERINSFIKRFAEQHNYTGQLAFDFIEDTQGNLYVLECNPRLTSGIHLFSDAEQVSCALLNTQPFQDIDLSPQSGTVPMISSMMWLYGFTPHRISNFLKDFRSGTDILWSASDPLPSFYQMLSLLELGVRSLKYGHPLLAASTLDIEWNGPNA